MSLAEIAKNPILREQSRGFKLVYHTCSSFPDLCLYRMAPRKFYSEVLLFSSNNFTHELSVKASTLKPPACDTSSKTELNLATITVTAAIPSAVNCHSTAGFAHPTLTLALYPPLSQRVRKGCTE